MLRYGGPCYTCPKQCTHLIGSPSAVLKPDHEISHEVILVFRKPSTIDSDIEKMWTILHTTQR